MQSSGQTFLIVTEGEKTEWNYFTKLCVRLKLTTTDVRILHPDGTDPITLTTKAIELRDERKKAAKKGNGVEYDEVWVVFDLEGLHDKRREIAAKAMKLKEAIGIKFAISDPCFEYWLLLHEEYTTTPFAVCDEVIRRLKRQWEDYQKEQPPTLEFIEKVPTAVINAKRCREHHDTCCSDGNPSTNVDLLARSLNGATRKHLRFDFP